MEVNLKMSLLCSSSKFAPASAHKNAIAATRRGNLIRFKVWPAIKDQPPWRAGRTTLGSGRWQASYRESSYTLALVRLVSEKQ